VASAGVSPAGSASGTAPTRQPASAGCAIAPAQRDDVPLGICAFAFAIARRRQRRARV
jgi:hypothetical protein